MQKNNSKVKFKPVNKTIKRNNSKKKYSNINKKKNSNKNTPKKTLNKPIKPVSAADINLSKELSVSIIAATNKEKYIDNIFKNYKRQLYENKELIIILNNNKINIDKCRQKAAQYAAVKVFQIEERQDLSDCINFGVSKSSFDLIAKFDDDDYYGPYYLTEAIYAIKNSKAGVVGKSKYYAYFEDIKKIGLRKYGIENSYTGYIHGPTLVIKRNIFNRFKFKNMPHGADQRFLKDCKENKIKIYSTSRKNFMYFRHKSLQDHTWKIKNSNFMKQFRIIRKAHNYIPS